MGNASDLKNSAARLALPVLFLGAAGIAFAPIFVRLSQVGPSATAFWRITFALPFFFLWLNVSDRGKRDRKEHPKTAGDFRALGLAGLFFAGDLAVWHWSIKLTTVANATLLANFAPVFVTLGAFFLFRERVTPRFLAGMLIALAGAVILMGNSVNLSLRYVAGDALGLLTAVFYAGYILSINRLRHRFSTAATMTWACLWCTLALLPITLLSGESLAAPSIRGWMVLLGLAIVSQLGGQGFIAYALAYLPAPFASVSLLLQPVIAAFLAWIILAESLGLLQFIGGVVIITGIVLARRGSGKQNQ